MSRLAAPALDDALMAPLPQFAGDELAHMLREHFGIGGSLARISGERDLNLHVACADGRDVVFKLAISAKPSSSRKPTCMARTIWLGSEP